MANAWRLFCEMKQKIAAKISKKNYLKNARYNANIALSSSHCVITQVTRRHLQFSGGGGGGFAS